MVIDSIQTMWADTVEAAPGSVAQVRASAQDLVTFAKRRGAAVVLVGHVTKEGTLAGPRVLEHLVDTVLYFEGDGAHALRILRAVKNRFGSTNEVAVFEMREGGLAEVANPSAAFLAERPVGVVPLPHVLHPPLPELVEVGGEVVEDLVPRGRQVGGEVDGVGRHHS